MAKERDIPQDGLFEMPPAQPPQATQEPSIEALVEQVRLQRQEAAIARQNVQLPLEDGEAAAPETSAAIPEQEDTAKRSSRRGGAFGGGLKRRIEQGELTETVTFDARDLRALAPLTLARELFSAEGDQVYAGVVFTPEEFGAITFSPQRLAQRIGNRVLKGTVGRPADARLARKDEVIKEKLEVQARLVQSCLANLQVDREVFADLAKEMRSPGYAHMSKDEMDALIAHSEGVYVSMFEAILTNRGIGTERVKNLTAAMYSLLDSKNYRQAFGYRKHLTNLGQDWTNAKINRLTEVQERVQNELNERFGHSA